MCKRQIRVFIFLFLIGSLFSCKTTKHHLADADVSYVRTVEEMPADNDIERFIAPFRGDLDKQMNVVIGELTEDLVKAKPNSNMGNWFCDILHAEAERLSGRPVDFAVQNHGGFRIPALKKGPITKGEIFELMPFDNALIIVEVKGAKVKQMLDAVANYGGWPISKNLSFKIVDDKAEDITIKGAPLDMSKVYSMAMPDYVANGGDKSGALEGVPQINLGLFIRDVVINHLQEKTDNNEEILIDSAKRIF